MFKTIDSVDRLEIVSPVPWGKRLMLGFLSLIPLLAPYELLWRVQWTSYLHPFFMLAALISAGAMALSAILVFAALAELDSRMTFDATRATFTYSAVAPVVARRICVCPLAALEGVEVRKHEWSDGGPSYALRVVAADGSVFESASSWSQKEAELGKARIESFLKQHSRRERQRRD